MASSCLTLPLFLGIYATCLTNNLLSIRMFRAYESRCAQSDRIASIQSCGSSWYITITKALIQDVYVAFQYNFFSLDVSTYHRPYKFGNVITNKALICKHGSAKKQFLMD